MAAQKRNYQKELDRIIEDIKRSGEPVKRPGLLLHSCCAPCSSYCLEYLKEYFEITDLYYNPNITDKEEYNKRADELERLIGIFNGKEGGKDSEGKETPDLLTDRVDNKISYIRGEYDPGSFFEAVKGLEDAGEGSRRCYKCYELRMEMAAREAMERKCDYFTTTLSISPLKNAQWINEIGERLSEKYGVEHLPSDFKKKEGYKRSTELSAKYGLYRQNYCGCVFSKRETGRGQYEKDT